MSANMNQDPTNSVTAASRVYFKNVVVIRDSERDSDEDSPKSGLLRRLIPGDPYSITFRSQTDGSMDAGSSGRRINHPRTGGFGFGYRDGNQNYESYSRNQFQDREFIPLSPPTGDKQIHRQSLDSAVKKGARSVMSSNQDGSNGQQILLTSGLDGYDHSIDHLQLQAGSQRQVVAGFNDGLLLCNGTSGQYECPDTTAMSTSPATASPDLLTKTGVGAILVVIFLISITINLVVLVMFCRRKVRLTVSSRFLLNLTVCNMLTVVFVLPFAFTSLIVQDWVFGDFWCHVTGFILNLVIAASTLTLIVISLDRYCAIVTPLHYPMKMTRKRSLHLIATVWVVALVCALPPIFGWNQMEFQPRKMICTVKWTSHLKFDSYYNLFIVFLCFLVPLVALLWAYGVIFHAAKENSKRTFRRGSVHFSLTGQSATCAVLSNSTGLISTSISAEASPALPSRRRSSSAPILGRRVSIQRLGNLLWYREERKTAVTCILIFMTFVACWSPYFAVIVVETFSQEDFRLPEFVDTISILLAVSSCALDPLVYVLRNSQLRHEICVMLRGEKINNTQLV